MVQHDLVAFKRPRSLSSIVVVVLVLLHTSSFNHVVVECQLNRSPRGLWSDLFGAVVTSLGEHVKRQRAREATVASVASSAAYTAAAAVTSSAAANHVASLAMGQSAMNGSSQQLFQPTSSK